MTFVTGFAIRIGQAAAGLIVARYPDIVIDTDISQICVSGLFGAAGVTAWRFHAEIVLADQIILAVVIIIASAGACTVNAFVAEI